METERIGRPLLQGKCNYAQPRISPNGRLLAYTSKESARSEVYVCAFPDVTGGKWQISMNGGDSPLWSPDGRELFFRNGDDVFATTVRPDPAFGNESPKRLFKGAYVAARFVLGALELSPWDIHPKQTACGSPECQIAVTVSRLAAARNEVFSNQKSGSLFFDLRPS
jgi:dipeptidyl aminopeptidase/acylaminoacyl peptidase